MVSRNLAICCTDYSVLKALLECVKTTQCDKGLVIQIVRMPVKRHLRSILHMPPRHSPKGFWRDDSYVST